MPALPTILRPVTSLLVVALLASCGGSSSDDGSGGGDGDGGIGPPPPTLATPQTCIAPERPTTETAVSTQRVFAAATIREPTKILQAPGDPSRWYVLQKGGQVMVFDVANPGGIRQYLSLGNRVLSNGEGGLLGMAFHPRFPATAEIFIFYSAPGAPLTSTLSRLVLDNALSPTTFTEQVLLRVNQPSINHHGGDLAFGPDGYLYTALGDGEPPAGARPVPGTTLAGAMLRLDVVDVAYPAPGYNIPPDNPFAANPRCASAASGQTCAEIWAYGFRNPWRWSFDPATGQIWLADVGEFTWEEINLIAPGRNYGWPCREGAHPYEQTPECPADLTDPDAEYGHGQGDGSIIGGYVYRGTAIPGLAGRYVFADYVSGRLFALRETEDGTRVPEPLADTPYSIPTLATGADGELYFARMFNFDKAEIHKIVPAGPVIPDTIPDDLTATGCVDPASPFDPAPSLAEYGINAPFWSDGALKSRFLAVPDDGMMTINPATGQLDLPPGSVVMKRFQLGGKPIETRLLMRHPDGVWAGYTYQWNEAGTAATRVRGGSAAGIDGQTWVYPSEGQCMRCHTDVGGFALGLTVAQLNRDFTTLPGLRGNQLLNLDQLGLLDLPGGTDPDSLPRLTDPADVAAPLGDRARAYLETNCAQCHQPGGPTPSGMDLRATTPLEDAGICNVVPAGNDLGLADARLVAPGAPERSVLLGRLGRRDDLRMPPLGSTVTDVEGAELVSAWIEGLTGCN